MNSISNFVTGTLQSFWKGIAYSVEHMSVTQWCILGTTSVVIGFLLLRTNIRL